MNTLESYRGPIPRFLFTDIDDTLTDEGQLKPDPYKALWDLKSQNIAVIPVTGRPAGWCEMMARLWPVEGVIGENGGFYFRYKEKTMIRRYLISEELRLEYRKRLDHIIRPEVLKDVPGAAVASDQFSRVLDLAIDFCEDVAPLGDHDIKKVVAIFEKHGAKAKVSSIHVNGWYGDYDKFSTCQIFLADQFPGCLLSDCAFVGDSPNDEPMFKGFNTSFAVANINKFFTVLKHTPTYLATKKGGSGFVEIVSKILETKQRN